ncbi:V-type ATPase subunit [Enterococcus sp. LJL98]
MNNSYHTINPLVRLKENELLTKDHFEQLIQAPTFEKVAEILAPTVYSSYLTENFQHHFEQSLNQELVRTYADFIDILPDPTLVWLYTMRYTIHNLKVLTKADQVHENYDYLFIPDGFYSLEELKAAIETGESGSLPPSVIQSIQEVRDYFEESRILQGVDVIYDRFYFKEQYEVAKQLKNPELLQAIVENIDLNNIIITARCLLQKRSYAFMSAVISDCGSIDKETLLGFSGKKITTLIEFLQQSDYQELLAPVLSPDKIDFLRLSVLVDNQLTTSYQAAHTQAFGPLPLLAYLNAKEMEIMNLRLIIVGKRSGFTHAAIKERMRTLYDE